jgi:hypothetical protein
MGGAVVWGIDFQAPGALIKNRVLELPDDHGLYQLHKQAYP